MSTNQTSQIIGADVLNNSAVQDFLANWADFCGAPRVTFEGQLLATMQDVLQQRGQTLDEAKAWLREAAKVGTICPCCNRHTQYYKRKLNSSMVAVLLRWYRHNAATGTNDFLHVSSWLSDVQWPSPEIAAAVRGDWPKLRFWRLIEEKAETAADGNPHAGFYRLTPQGVEFCLGAVRVRSHIWIYNDKPLPEKMQGESRLVHVKDVLGTKFNYAELMGTDLSVS